MMQNRILKTILSERFWSIFGRFGQKSLYKDKKKFFGQDDPLKDEVSLLGQKIFEFASY